MRTYSDYKMMHQLYPTCAIGNSRLCPNRTFAETIQDELNDADRPSECFFNTTVGLVLFQSNVPEDTRVVLRPPQ